MKEVGPYHIETSPLKYDRDQFIDICFYILEASFLKGLTRL